MSGGFGAVPEELFRTANSIGDVIGSAAGLLWQGPSGDYGHRQLQTGWTGFIESIEAEVARLAEQTQGHGDNLRTAAGKYLQSDDDATGTVGGFGAGLGDLFPTGGGQSGNGIDPLPGIGGPGEAKIGSKLDGVPGGGWTGGLTPRPARGTSRQAGRRAARRSRRWLDGRSDRSHQRVDRRRRAAEHHESRPVAAVVPRFGRRDHSPRR